MFLLERVIGISVFAIFLLVIATLISKCSNVRSTKKILILYLIILFIMGYFYLPHKTADLYYIKNLINTNLIYKDFTAIVEMTKNTGFSIYYIYYWIFGQLGNTNLLPAFTALFFYGNVFYILYKSCIHFNASPKTMARTLCFFMASGQFLEVISGIKSFFAFSIVAVCCYREFVENKSFILHLPFYLFASLMHDAALIAVGFRLLYLLFQKENKWIVKIRNILIFTVFTIFAFKFGQDIIMGATEKGQGYIHGNVYSNYWEYTIGIFCNLFMIYSILLIRKIIHSDKKIKNEILKCTNFVIFVLAFDCFFIFEYSIFHRYSTFAMILIIPIITILFEKHKNNEYTYLNKYYTKFQIFFFITFILSLIRGNLSNLKFF